jgi:hypothetical protein
MTLVTMGWQGAFVTADGSYRIAGIGEPLESYAVWLHVSAKHMSPIVCQMRTSKALGDQIDRAPT